MSDQTASCDGWHSGGCVGTSRCPPRCPRFVDKQGVRWTLRPAREGGIGADDDGLTDDAHDDLDALADMYAAFGTGDRAQGVPPADERQRRSWIETLLAEGHNVVAAGDGRLVGHAVYTPTGEETPELAVFVHPACQRRGIGTELCKHVIAAAADAGCEALVLHVEAGNRAARTVYRRLGFEVLERDRELVMRLALDEPIATAVRKPPAVREPSA